MAPDIALDAIPEKKDQTLTVLDPMCGSGTVLSAALERGHDAIGVDIDPLAVMMSRLAVTPVDAVELLTRAGSVVSSARRSPGVAPWRDDSETEAFVNYWFAPKQKRDLIDLLSAIAALDERDLRLALRLAVSRIIVTKSPQASLAADTSHSRPHRVRTESDYEVYEGFQRSVKQLSRMLDKRQIHGRCRVELGDSRQLQTVADGSVDLAVTSPPYLNALDYLRGHRLALVWFGHTVAGLRQRRGESIGAERALAGAATEAVSEIVDVIEGEALDRSALKRPMLERFAHDCIGFAGQLAAKVKAGGEVVLVVGNSTLRGNYIKNDLIAQKAMEYAGFGLLTRMSRPIPARSRYMAINTADAGSAMGKRMRDEVVLRMVRDRV
jgi:SAM-dependent methyltransferase